MSKIGLVDVDSHNFPNLPLMKLSAHHKALGDSVEWANGFEHYDCIYMSKIFTFTPDDNNCYNADVIYQGGTGYDMSLAERFLLKNHKIHRIASLPDDVERCCPDYALYPQYSEAYGFLTRGCPRSCAFCIVSEKEGRYSRRVADLSGFWRGQREIKLLDANLLACREREVLLQQLIDSGAWIDFTQGLDIRLTDAGITKMITAMKVKLVHFAWDNPNEDLSKHFTDFKVRTGFDVRKLQVYVLVNFDSTHEQDLYRIYKLRELGYTPYVMIYEKETAPQKTRHLARWVNSKIIWRSCPRFEDYDPKRG